MLLHDWIENGYQTATSRVAVKVHEKMFKIFFKSYTLTIKTLLSIQTTYKVEFVCKTLL